LAENAGGENRARQSGIRTEGTDVQTCRVHKTVTPNPGFSAIGAFSNALILRHPLPKATGPKDAPVGAGSRPLERPHASLRAGSLRLLFYKSASERGGLGVAQNNALPEATMQLDRSLLLPDAVAVVADQYRQRWRTV
jgi:hypothetical protein